MLHATRGVVEEPVGEPCDVPDGDRAIGADDGQGVVGEDPVAEVEPVAVEPAGGGHRADRLDDQVREQDRVIVQVDPGHPVGAGIAPHAGPDREPQAARLVVPLDRLGQGGAQDAVHRGAGGLDDGHVVALGDEGAGRLAAHNRPDHDDPSRPVGDLGPQGQAVLDRA